MSEHDDGQDSDSGQIRRYPDGPKPFEPPDSAAGWCDQITSHVERYIGPSPTVWHEIISSHVHIDVLAVEPDADRPWLTFVTSGMSDRPMTVPAGAEEYRYAELVILLPPDWPHGDESFKDERNYWPMRLLKSLARFPHEYETWLGWGHSVPNGDPPEPYAENTELCGAILLPALRLPEQFFELAVHDDKVIHFFALYPLYREEMDFKIRHGSEELIERFEKHGTTDVVDLRRPNVCGAPKKRRWWPFA